MNAHDGTANTNLGLALFGLFMVLFVLTFVVAFVYLAIF
jgi:hypothetical protein